MIQQSYISSHLYANFGTLRVFWKVVFISKGTDLKPSPPQMRLRYRSIRCTIVVRVTVEFLFNLSLKTTNPPTISCVALCGTTTNDHPHLMHGCSLPPPPSPPPPKKIARALPGTMVFFDKFCPDLHGASAAARPPVEGRRGGSHSSPSSSTPFKHRVSSSSSLSSMLAACRWCSAELGNASVFILSDDDDDDDKEHCCSVVQGFHADDDAHQAGTGRAEGGEGGAGAPRVALGLRDFLGDFVGGEAVEELARRGDVLRGLHLSNNVGK